MPLNPTTAIYTDKTAKNIVLAAAVLSIVALLATLWIVYDSWNAEKEPFLLYVTIGAWAVCPPAWFWYEYYYFYREYGQPDTLELFRYGQDVSKAIWAGVLAGLIALAASDVVKHRKDDSKCCIQAQTTEAPKRIEPQTK